MTSYKNRPKWAKRLTKVQWQMLHLCQEGRPTLTRLKADVAFQKGIGYACPYCERAFAAIAKAVPE